MICVCGHAQDWHWDEDDHEQTINEGTGHCNKFIAVGHHCSSCGYDPEDYCRCSHYKPDNLAYVEKVAEERKLI